MFAAFSRQVFAISVLLGKESAFAGKKIVLKFAGGIFDTSDSVFLDQHQISLPTIYNMPMFWRGQILPIFHTGSGGPPIFMAGLQSENF